MHAIALTVMMKGMGKGHSWSEFISGPFLRRRAPLESPRSPGVPLQSHFPGRLPTLEKTCEMGMDELSSSWLDELLVSCGDIILAKATSRKEDAVPPAGAVLVAGAGSRAMHIRSQAAVSDQCLRSRHSPLYSSEPSPWNNATQI